MKVSIESDSLHGLLEDIGRLCGEIERLDAEPEADPKPVLEQYDLTWGKMWELADSYEAAGHSFPALLEKYTGERALREVPIGAWAAIASAAKGQLVVDGFSGASR